MIYLFIAFLVVASIEAAAVLLLWDRDKQAWAAERKELLRRLTEPRAVQIQERPMHPRPPVISQGDDAAYKKLREERMN